MRALLIIAVLLLTSAVHSAVVFDTLYIIEDSIEVSTGGKLPYITFNRTTTFSQTNARLILNEGDQLELLVVNLDDIDHEFEVKDQTATYSILAGNQLSISYTFTSAGLFIFRDPMNFPDYSSVGLSGMIVVKNHSHSSFYWNIKEHKSGLNTDVLNGGTVDWSLYYPEFFTINGNSHPNINTDVSARITGNIGDTLILYLANTGQSIHPMHFHGYHVEVLFSSKSPQHVGRMKDSQGIFPSEGVVLQLVPDKVGEYPVHDHNLISTTGANLYPLGMFTTILITP
ncbi:MAG: multicopper oxidase domain-containing protein [Crocinitomicaceae bacterium]|nr:multicopper oxidase domain-containing protein [Crocinitomicaceae bacterium]